MSFCKIEAVHVCCDWCGEKEIIIYPIDIAKQVAIEKGYVITEYVLCKECAK